jgi:hypothetical protein
VSSQLRHPDDSRVRLELIDPKTTMITMGSMALSMFHSLRPEGVRHGLIVSTRNLKGVLLVDIVRL